MQLTVSGKQLDLSDALRIHVEQHLDVITNKYFDHALEALVTFGKARSFFTCGIQMHAGRGITVRGEGEAADARAAFDDAAAHIATRLRRYRRRVSAHAREETSRADPEFGRQFILRDDAQEGLPEGQAEDRLKADSGPTAEDDAEVLHATVIAESDTAIETLSVRDAVMRMDLADQHVLMFRNTKNGLFNVVYRRSDGHIGWIDPRPN